MDEKIEASKRQLGTHWVLHPKSTYPMSMRQMKGSVVLAPVAAAAIAAGRLAVFYNPDVTTVTSTYRRAL